MFKIRFIVYKSDTLEIIETARTDSVRFARRIHDTPGVECMDVTYWGDRELLARINAANGTDYGHYYTVKGKDGNSYDIIVDALNGATSELHSCLKVCHRINISDSDVLRTVLMRHFPHEFTDLRPRWNMSDIARIGKTIASQMHLYFTFKAKR